jgi:hypothetical protein
MSSLTMLAAASKTTRTPSLACLTRRVAISVFLVLFSLSLFAAGHDVSDVRYAPAGLGGIYPVIAANGRRFLTVWAMDAVYPMPNIAFGAVTEAGEGPSSLPFLLPGVTGVPSAIMPWRAGGFISLWYTREGFDIVTHLASGGVEHISHVARIAGPPRFATNGRELLVVDIRQPIQFNNRSNIIDASLYEPDGTLLARTVLPVAAVATFDVVRAGDSYVLVTGADSGQVHFFRLDDGGRIIAEKELQGVAPPYPLYAPAVAVSGDGERTIVAWSATESSAASFTTVSSSDEVAAPQLLPRKFSRYTGLRIVRTTAGYLLIGNERRYVSVVRTDAAGRILDGDAIPIANDYSLNDAAAAGDQFAVAMVSDSSPPSSPVSMVTGTVLPDGVTASVSPIVTLTAARQEQPVIASDGVDYAAAWLEHDGPDLIAKIGRVSRTGAPLDGPGVTLPAPTKHVLNLSIARGAGGDALVVVSALEGTWAFRWSRTVGLVDTTPILLDPRRSDFGNAVAWNGASYLALWVDSNDYSLAGRFIGSDGTPAAKFRIPMTLFSDEQVQARYPAEAWDGRQFLISIPTAYPFICPSLCGSPVATEVRLVRVSGDGSLLDKAPYRILKAVNARVATSGREFVLLTSDYDKLTAVVVHGETSALSVSTPILSAPSTQGSEVIWDGAYYDVSWAGDSWLRLWRLNPTGTIVQKSFRATTTPFIPSIAANDAGEVTIAVSEDAPPSNLSRARVSFASELQPVPATLGTPTNAVSHFSNSYTRLQWDGDAPGFIIEHRYGSFWFWVRTLSDGSHEATLNASPGDFFRIRAFGPEGSTLNGAITGIESRGRSVRR